MILLFLQMISNMNFNLQRKELLKLKSNAILEEKEPENALM